jgi:adhesin transport system outer membrane protein
MHKAFLPLLTCCALLLAAARVPAQTTDPLRDAVQKAIATNPEVTASFNAFRASTEEVDVAAGGFYPRVDLSADAAANSDRSATTPEQTNSFGQRGVALSVTQMLWDGLATRHEVQRLGHARLTRYFEFLDASEQTALEAVRAYEDVQRYRRRVLLAEDNYVQHKYAHDQIQSRVRAGVARGVDLEQAAARLALADSNRVTEVANLHDVAERYRRVVGEAPPERMPRAAGLDRSLPGSHALVIQQAGMRSAAVAAAVENLRAAQLQARSRDSLFQPRVEARLRSGAGRNFDGVEDQKRDSTAGVFLSWNLFSGGSDQARVRQAAHLMNQAADLRDKACRDARQVASIAYNDLAKLVEQRGYLDRNVLAIEKARDAYRQQFDIGQRSLLDLLNSENELYTARLAYANVDYDLSIARARTHAGMSSLVAVLGLTRAGAAQDVPDLQAWQAGDDAAARCPASPTSIASASKADLDARAQRLVVPTPMAAARPPQAPPAPAASAPAREPSAPASLATQQLLDWAGAWMAKDVSRYMGFYADGFQPTLAASRAEWVQQRRRLVAKRGPIDVRIDNVQTRTLSSTLVETSFDQSYASSDYVDRTRKTLTWQRLGDRWLIVGESNR